MADEIKIICTSDLHLGCTLPLPQSASPEVQQGRIDDGLSAFEAVVAQALRQKADFLVVCGDVFHTLRPSGYVFNRFARNIGKLSSAGIQTVVVAGNHDMPRATDTEPYLSALEEVGTPGFHFVKEPTLLKLKGKNQEISFVCVPYVHLTSTSDQNRYVRQHLGRLLQSVTGDYALVLSHLVVGGSSVGALRELLPYPENVVSFKALAREGVDLVLLGHLHEHQVIREKVIYPGSLERMSFSEENSRKGFVEIRGNGKKLSWSFIESRARPLAIHPRQGYIDLTESKEPTADLLSLLEGTQFPHGCLLKLKLRIGPKHILMLEKVVERLRSRGVFYPVCELDRGKVSAPLLQTTGLSLEKILREYVDKALKGKFPDKVLELVKEEGAKVIREVGETL